MRPLHLHLQRRRRTNATIEKTIDEAWEGFNGKPGQEGVEDRGLTRLIAFGTHNGQLALYTGATTLREYVGTNLEHPEFHELYGEDYMANPLGVSAVLVSAARPCPRRAS